MVTFEIITGIQTTILIRSYLPLDNMDRLPDLEGALNHFLGGDTIVMGTLMQVLHRWKPLEPAGGIIDGIFQYGRPLRSL